MGNVWFNNYFNFFSAPYNADCEDPYPSLSDFHDYEPNLEFDDSDLLQTKHPENDDELELPEVDRQNTPNTYIESPMSDGTIEEDFEQALAREIADRRGSGEHVVNAGNMTVEGSLEDDDFSGAVPEYRYFFDNWGFWKLVNTPI